MLKSSLIMLTKKSGIVLGFLVIFVLFLFRLFIEYKFKEKTFTNPISPKPQLWSHRGAGEFCAENSICSFEQAVAKGAQGIEIDVYFVPDSCSFVVTHDTPQVSNKYPRLEDYFDRFKDSTFYWIDLKNINTSNANIIAEQLSQLSLQFHLKDKIFVESANAASLEKISKKNIKTLYWLQFNRDHILIQQAKLFLIKYLLVRYKFSGVSTSALYYDSKFKSNFPQIPVFIFHPSDSIQINLLRRDTNVNVILTDSYFLKRDENN